MIKLEGKRTYPHQPRMYTPEVAYQTAARMFYELKTVSINLSGFGLTSLPPIPRGVLFLNVRNNKLTSLPDLPESLLSLECSKNQLTSLPRLPSSLYELTASDNLLTSFPECSADMFISCVVVENNRLTELPDNLNTRSLYCGRNAIRRLPKLHPQLQHLDISRNHLSELPEDIELPREFLSLMVSSNRLTSLPSWYHAVGRWDVRDNYLPDRGADETEDDWMYRMYVAEESRSIGRINTRCQAIAEELLEVSLHPDRVGARMSKGMSLEDM